ncbi:MAG TPA: VTT domain-containing protein [Terracidiphilus sp.]|jgi:membrane protein DedA with SNARE-associated domain/rhodanese-related sulfurtransferase
MLELDASHHPFGVIYLILWAAVFARQVCLPIPANLFLLTAGALVHRGEMNVGLVLMIGILGCLAGDFVWFEAGRHWGRQIMRIFCAFSADPHYCAQRANGVFARWGLRSLVVAKFIPGLDGVTPPLAGIEGASRRAFFNYDFLGSLIWTGVYVGLGYLFANRLAIIAASMARFGAALAVGAGIPLACYVGWRAWIIVHMLRHLRLRRITPSLLNERITSGQLVAVIDLLDFEDEHGGRAGIPGAVRMSPSRLRSRSRVIVPEGLEMVLYCTSSGELTSARVAVALKKKGVSNVWVLEGGLTAWEREGFPVTLHLSTSNEAAERFGIRVIENRSGATT